MSAARALRDVPSRSLREALSGQGLWLDYGAARTRLRSDCAVFSGQLQRAYAQFAFDTHGDWADLHVEVKRVRGLRRWFAPQVQFVSDGASPFEPFPADSPLPHFEWGSNWLFGRRMNHLLLFHAGVVERDGLALLLPATPGSGKSTLTAALSLRGWRLLSDEFGAWDPEQGAFVSVLKPIALKNQSIGVIRAFEPSAPIGQEFPRTRKGTVAHLAADAAAVRDRGRTAAPGAVILPRWEAGSPTRLEPLSADDVFPALAFNAFNYGVLGATAFDAAVRLARRAPAWRLVYSRLDDALAAIDSRWPEVRDRSRSAAGAAAGGSGR